MSFLRNSSLLVSLAIFLVNLCFKFSFLFLSLYALTFSFRPLLGCTIFLHNKSIVSVVIVGALVAFYSPLTLFVCVCVYFIVILSLLNRSFPISRVFPSINIYAIGIVRFNMCFVSDLFIIFFKYFCPKTKLDRFHDPVVL